MVTCFNFWNDPGHGWLQVSDADLRALGLTRADFSKYSYARNDQVYLEEDCDASKFIGRYVERNRITPKFASRHSNRDSFIRSLPRIN